MKEGRSIVIRNLAESHGSSSDGKMILGKGTRPFEVSSSLKKLRSAIAL